MGNNNNSNTLIDSTSISWFDDLPTSILIHKNGIIKYLNKETCIITGCTKEALIGSNVLDRVCPDHRKKVIQKIEILNRGDQYDDYEIDLFGPDNSIRTALVRARRMMYENEPANLVMLHDITDMKNLEKALIQGKKEIEIIMNSINSGVVIINAKTHVIEKINTTATLLINLAEGDILGRKCNMFICPNDEDHCPVEIGTMGEDLSERTLITGSGERIPILKKVKKFIFEEKECYLESFVDIRELKKNEQTIIHKERILSIIAELTFELLKSESYHEVLENNLGKLGLAIGVDRIYLFENEIREGSLLNTTSHKIEWNATGTGLLKNDPEMQRTPFEKISLFIEPLKKNQSFAATTTELQPSETKELLEKRNTKSILVLPLWVDDLFWGFVGIDECKTARNWTEAEHSILLAFAGTLSAAIERRNLEKSLKKSMEEAQQASRAKSDFLANMSHEIRTPLNTISGFSDLLLKTEMNNTQKEYINAVNNSAEILMGLINDILDYSKIEAGRLELTEERTNILKLCEQITEIYKFTAFDKGLELLLNIQQNIPNWIFTDSIRLKQVLINLLWNAIKFTEKGEVELSIRYEKHEVNEDYGYFHFKIRDTGIGIEKDKQKLIFEMFSQADTSTSRKYGGTGLGLPISIGILQLMNSTLFVKSEPGIGSTFSFSLLLRLSSDSSTEKSFSVQNIRKVFILDDNITNQIILKNMLKHLNIEVEIFNDPDSGLKAVDPGYDAYILTYSLPALDGIEFANRLHEKFKEGDFHRPIVLLHSSNDEVSVKSEASKSGIMQVFSKPLTINNLQKMVIFMENEMIVQKNKEQKNKSDVHCCKVLIVEDNISNVKLAQTYVKIIVPDCSQEVAYNGKEAFDIYQKFRPDIVLMDIQMPVTNGYDSSMMIRQYEKENSLGRVPIVAITAGTIAGSKEKCIKAGMDDFLAKPLMLNDLKVVMERWRDRKGKAQEDDAKNHFDKKEFLEYILNNEELFRELIEITKETLTKGKSDMRKAFVEKDINSIKEIAHLLKGHSLTMFFRVLHKVSLSIESSAINNDYDGISQQMENIEKEIDNLVDIYLN